MRHAIGSIIATLGLLAGCAGIDSKSIPPRDADLDTVDAKDLGFRYYETSPFLLLYADGKGGLVSKVLYLPDTTKKRSIRPYNYGAKNDVTLKFDHGRLVQAKAVVDETVIPVAVVAALEKVAVAYTKAGNGGSDTLPVPSLYRILGKPDGTWSLEGTKAAGITIKYDAK